MGKEQNVCPFRKDGKCSLRETATEVFVPIHAVKMVTRGNCVKVTGKYSECSEYVKLIELVEKSQ